MSRALAVSLSLLVGLGCSAGGVAEKQREVRHHGGNDAPSASKIKHLVLILQENHSFDSYFGRYCRGPANPTCTSGRDCCEAAPASVPSADGACRAQVITDGYNGGNDPDHTANAEYQRMHWNGSGFLMNRYPCGNVAYAAAPDESYADAVYPAVAAPDDAYPLRTYHNLAAGGALADRYFQPIVGASSSNDMFLARAAFVFQDNQAVPRSLDTEGRLYTDTTIADLMDRAGVSWRMYMEGFSAAQRGGPIVPYPNGYDGTDNPFNYYQNSQNKTADYQRFGRDLDADTLPAVSIIRGLGIHSDHPGDGVRISDGERFVKSVIDRINGSDVAADTLILVGWDEGGGYYDHVAPPERLADGTPLPTTPLGASEPGDHSTQGGVTLPASLTDPEYYSNGANMAGQEHYGTRTPLLALGPFAKPNYVSHVVMEHSSIVRFIEWNWLGDQRLGTRDQHVNGLDDLLDPAALGTTADPAQTPR